MVYRPSNVILTKDTSVGLPTTAAEPPAVIPKNDISITFNYYCISYQVLIS